MIPDHFTVELNDTGVSILDWAMTINNGLSGAERHDLGSGTIKEPVRVNKQVISGSFTAEFDDTEIYALFAARAASKLELLYDGDTALYTIDSGQVYSLHLTLPTIFYQAGQKPVSGMGPIIQSFQFQAVYDVDNDTHALSIALVNSDTGY